MRFGIQYRLFEVRFGHEGLHVLLLEILQMIDFGLAGGSLSFKSQVNLFSCSELPSETFDVLLVLYSMFQVLSTLPRRGLPSKLMLLYNHQRGYWMI